MTEMEWRRAFAEKLICKMNYAGVDQMELARISKISQASLSKYIAGIQSPKFTTVVNLAKALKCGVFELAPISEVITK